jgi:hypothetical protein
MPRKKTGASEEIERIDPEQSPLPGPTGLEGTLSPVDLPPPPVPLPHPLRWTTSVIVIATLVLALFNARTLQSWSYQLPPNAATARIVTGAEAWYAATDRFGLNRPVAILHGWWEKARTARFPGIPGPPDAAAGEDPPQR